MKKEYQISKTPETGKWIITYYVDDVEETKEQYAYADGIPIVQIKHGYTERLNRLNIPEYQQYLCNELDNRTQATIASGFVFDNITFSLSQNAQINISNIPNIPEQAFPFAYLGKEDEYYELSFANKMNFYFTALDAVKSVRISNGALKLQVKELTTTEELDLFKEQHGL
jgi:hypothetical protein